MIWKQCKYTQQYNLIEFISTLCMKPINPPWKNSGTNNCIGIITLSRSTKRHGTGVD